MFFASTPEQKKAVSDVLIAFARYTADIIDSGMRSEKVHELYSQELVDNIEVAAKVLGS